MYSDKNRWPIILLIVYLASALSGCPSSSGKGADGTGTPQPVSELPVFKIPGLHLVYTVNNPRSDTEGNPDNSHVLIAEPDGSRREVLFNFSGFIFHTVPSPIGTHIAFVANVPKSGGTDERHIFIYNIATGDYRDVSEGGYYTRLVTTAPMFNADGSSVLFISRRAEDYPLFNIFKCDIATGRTGGLYTQSVEDVPLELMNGGQECVAVRKVPDAVSAQELIAINIETGAERALYRFDNVTKVGPACVSRDGNRIFCDVKPTDEGTSMGTGARSREVWSIDLQTGKAVRLLDPMTVTYVYQDYIDPDGNERLLLRRQEDTEGEDTPLSRIATCLTDGSDFTYLTDTSARAYLFGPPPKNTKHVSPDNRLLFYYKQDPVFKHEDIWVMKPDGTDPINISNTAGYGEGSAGWIEIPL